MKNVLDNVQRSSDLKKRKKSYTNIKFIDFGVARCWIPEQKVYPS